MLSCPKHQELKGTEVGECQASHLETVSTMLYSKIVFNVV